MRNCCNTLHVHVSMMQGLHTSANLHSLTISLDLLRSVLPCHLAVLAFCMMAQ